jgi:hypothetical protein
MPITVLRKPVFVNTLFRVVQIFCLTVGLVGGQSINATHGQIPSGNQQDAASSQSSGSQSPSQTAVQQPQASVERAEGQQREKDANRPTLTDWIQVGINGALLVIIVFQTAIYRQQRKIMQRQIEHAKISERAYIGIKQVVTENYSLGAVPVVRVTIVNGGRTPAWKLKTPATFRLTDEGFPHERPDLGDVVGSSFLPAGSWTTCSLPFGIELTPEWNKAIQTGKRRAFVHMEVHFEDAWGQPQITSFKLEYRLEDGRWGEYKAEGTADPIMEITP